VEESREGIRRFNIRVYMLLMEGERLLLSDEMIRGKAYTKFPGGGLEFGEGLEEGLKREAMEELGQEVEVLEHFYTTDFFQRSGFRDSDQLIAVYFRVRLKEKPRFKTADKKFDFDDLDLERESFRWVSLEEMKSEDLSFPVDKHVLSLLQS
jgi:8-oxo-dGTP diphosphatase